MGMLMRNIHSTKMFHLSLFLQCQLQATEREKHLLNAQLTAASKKISTSTQTLHSMLLSFAQSAGMDLGSNFIDFVPGNFEYLFEYARFLFSKLLQSHKQATHFFAEPDDIHSQLNKDRERDRDRDREKDKDRERDRDRDRARDKGFTFATTVELISSEVRDGDCDEDESDSMGGEEGRLDEQYDFMFPKDDSRYIDDEIIENKAVNESLLAAYLPIIQGGSGPGLGSGVGLGSGPGVGVGSVSKASDSDRSLRASKLQTFPSSSSQQEQGIVAVGGGVTSMNGSGQYPQRGTRSNGEKRDGRYIPSDHHHPQHLRQQQQQQQQSHHRKQLQERDHTGSTDIEMSSTDFIRYLRARRRDGSDPSNSSVQRHLFRSGNSDSAVASG